MKEIKENLTCQNCGVCNETVYEIVLTGETLCFYCATHEDYITEEIGQ